MVNIEKIGDITEVKFEIIRKINFLVGDQLLTKLQKTLETPNVKILINMEQIQFLDSSGFATFLSILKTTNTNHGQLILYNMSESAFELFKVLQLHNLFKIADTKDNAIKTFK